MSGEVSESQNGADTIRARAQPDEAAPPPAPPGAENETQIEVVETVTRATVTPDGNAGEAMVGLLARRAALPRKVIDAIERALEAKRWSFDRKTNQRIYEDDHRAQLEAAKLYLEYVVGRPVERELVMTNGQGEGGTLDEFMASPALRRALARRLEIAETNAVKKGC